MGKERYYASSAGSVLRAAFLHRRYAFRDCICLKPLAIPQSVPKKVRAICTLSNQATYRVAAPIHLPLAARVTLLLLAGSLGTGKCLAKNLINLMRHPLSEGLVTAISGLQTVPTSPD